MQVSTMALKSVFIDEIPAEERGCRLQVCRISAQVAEQSNGLSLGQCIRIRTHHMSVICRIFPANTCDSFIQYDPCVTETLPPLCDQQSDVQTVHIDQLNNQEGKKIHVKLVLTDIHHYRNIQSNTKAQAELSRKCFLCLRNVCVTAGCSVDLGLSRLGKIHGIKHCFVQQCASDTGLTDTKTAVKVTQRTCLQIDDVQSWECYQLLKHTSSTVNLVAGLEQERKLLADLLKLSSHVSGSEGVLLRGPPGCGKTSLVRQVAQDCKAALLLVSGTEVVSANPGESELNLTALFDKAVRVCKEVPCLLFIDEADSICPKRGKVGASNSSRLTTALLLQLDRVRKVSGLLVVMATNRASALDPDVRRPGRLDKEILISVPTSIQRRQIFDMCLRKLPFASDLDLDWLSSVTAGYVGADIESVCASAQSKAWRRNSSHAGELLESSKEKGISRADMEAALLTFTPSMQRGVDCVVDARSVPWTDIGGLDLVKLQIQQAIEWPLLYPETYAALGLPLTKGVLLYGPPGCGKTTLAQAAATACHVTFLSLSCAQLYSPYVGDSEKKISETFQKARALAPSILFLDEMDAIVGKRTESTSGSGVTERVLSALLNEMDGIGVRLDDKSDSRELEIEGGIYPSQTQVKQHAVREAHDRHVLVVAATNRPDMLDPALLRPGRMDRLIYVPPPDAQGRLQNFTIHTRKMPLGNDVDLKKLAELTAGYTGADIKTLCNEAGLLALKESMDAECVGQDHFLNAIKICKPSLSADAREVEAMYKQLQR